MENALPLLLLLACPVGMVAMMFFMGKGMKKPKAETPASLADLKSEQARLDDRIAQLQESASERPEPVPSGRR